MTKQPIFSSKPVAVTEWICLGSRRSIRRPVVSTTLRALAIRKVRAGSKGRLEFSLRRGIKERLEAEGMKLTPELAAAFSPYQTHHANRFGMYELRERDLEPIDYGVTFQM